MSLDAFKIAAVSSALRPMYSSKPPKTTTPPPKKPFISSQGDRMRRETESAIEKSMKQGALAALERFKVADMFRTPSPSNHPLMPARPGVMSSQTHRPAQAPAPQPGVQPMAAPSSAAPVAAAGGSAPPTSRFKLPSLAGMLPSMGGVKKTIGLMGLGALGAGAYGLHKQHERDREGHRLVYAPMQGSLYG